MTELADRVAEAIEEGVLAPRVWLYATYHCNLECGYCLTESSPRAQRRELDGGTMVAVAHQARELGFTSLGMTGGEVFMRPELPELLDRLTAILPLVVLTNGTLFSDRLLGRIAPLAARPLELQISLDSADPVANDAMRGPENFAKVVAAVPRLVAQGHVVRIATTLEQQDDADMERLCALHRSLGVDDDHHLVRPIVHRGRAIDNDLGVAVGMQELFPELTITADGAFWNPFAPTVHGGRLDTDLLVTRRVLPLSAPVADLLGLIDSRPVGNDALLGIR